MEKSSKEKKRDTHSKYVLFETNTQKKIILFTTEEN